MLNIPGFEVLVQRKPKGSNQKLPIKRQASIPTEDTRTTADIYSNIAQYAIRLKLVPSRKILMDSPKMNEVSSVGSFTSNIARSNHKKQGYDNSNLSDLRSASRGPFQHHDTMPAKSRAHKASLEVPNLNYFPPSGGRRLSRMPSQGDNSSQNNFQYSQRMSSRRNIRKNIENSYVKFFFLPKKDTRH
jgi:hypothetical protein